MLSQVLALGLEGAAVRLVRTLGNAVRALVLTRCGGALDKEEFQGMAQAESALHSSGAGVA